MTEAQRERAEKLLQGAIEDVLAGPASDPLDDNLASAAKILEALWLLDLNYAFAPEFLIQLKYDNLYNSDWLSDVDPVIQNDFNITMEEFKDSEYDEDEDEDY